MKFFAECLMMTAVMSVILFLPSVCSADSDPDIKYVQLDDDTLRAEFTIPGSFDRLWNAINDYANSDKIMPNIKKTTVLSSETSGGTVISCVETTVASGPFSITYQSKLTAVKKDGILVWDQIKGGFTKNRGSWKLSSVSPTETHVVYENCLSHPFMPEWIKRSLVKKSVPDLYNSLVKAAAE